MFPVITAGRFGLKGRPPSPRLEHFHRFKRGHSMLYFAYGSNMNWQQMQDRCPSARFFGVALLPDHKLAFTRESDLDCRGDAHRSHGRLGVPKQPRN
jgi:hypothetical protein